MQPLRLRQHDKFPFGRGGRCDLRAQSVDADSSGSAFEGRDFGEPVARVHSQRQSNSGEWYLVKDFVKKGKELLLRTKHIHH
jgi:hypothetical protein